MSESDVCDELDELLRCKVRVFTLEQIARTWFSATSGPLSLARKCVAKMAAAGSVSVTKELLHPEVDVTKPLFEWKAGYDERPDLGRVAWKAKSRFRASSTQTVVVRSVEARRGRSTELLHDVMLSGVFLNLRKADPTIVRSWTHEDHLSPACRKAFGSRVPDAVLHGDTCALLIEIIGSYDKRRLKETFTSWRSFTFRFY
jgi:hypothetical protein